MFSKAHYQLLAEAINRELMREAEQVCMKRLIDDLCETFAKDNPNFRREQFIEACWKGVV